MHFGFKGTNSSLTFNASEWKSRLEDQLGSITNISEIEIPKPDLSEELKFDDAGQIPQLEEAGHFPTPPRWDTPVKFKLYIPTRIQKEITDSSNPATYTENFSIEIFYPFYMPVAIVTPIEPSKESDPSTALMLVRKFIEKEFKEKSFDYVDFQSLGPSPFHADFFIYEKDDDYFEADSNYEMNITKDIGYDLIEFQYSNKFFKDSNEFFDEIKREFINEAGAYYQIIQLKNRVRTEWEELEILVALMINDFQEKRLFSIGRSINSHLNETLINFSLFKMNEINNIDLISKIYSSTYEKDEGLLKEYLTYEVNEEDVYPSAEVGELLFLFEQRRSKKTEYVVCLLAAILGGVIGSFLTSVLSTSS